MDRQNSLQKKFLWAIIPIVFLTIAIPLSLYEYRDYRNGIADLNRALDTTLRFQGDVIAHSLWYVDKERIDHILQAAIADPDIAGITLFDEDGKIFANVGTSPARNQETALSGSIAVHFDTPEGREQIGTLAVEMTPARLVGHLVERVAFTAALALIVILAICLFVGLVFRRTIVAPLVTLINAMNAWRETSVFAPIRWSSDDELGNVVASFNDMQRRQYQYQQELSYVANVAQIQTRALEERNTAYMTARREAEEANSSKSLFLANMSHELRTPLNAILGFSELIKLPASDTLGRDRMRDYATDIHDAGKHLLDIINDVLDMSKIEAGMFELQEEVISVDRLVKDSLRMIGPRVEAAHLFLNLNLPGYIPKVRADSRAMKQILLNLLSNAVKFTPPGGFIDLDVQVDVGNGLSITIRDSGIGIADDMAESVLEPFHQATDAMTRSHEGTGLGLSITRAFVELHEGTLTLESKLGQGTSVTVHLPQDRLVDRDNEAEHLIANIKKPGGVAA